MAIWRLMGLLLLFPALAGAVDLSGEWQGSDGGAYYLVQDGRQLSWYAERGATSPDWAHIFDGRVRGETIRGKWTDVPKGRTRGHGELELSIQNNGNVLAITRKTGGFGGDSLTRVGYVPPVPVKPLPMPVKPPVTMVKPVKPVKPPVVAVKPMPMTPMVKEDCIAFNWRTATRQQVNGSWKIVDGSHWLFDFADKADEATKALNIIKRYRMDSSCFVGRPDPSLSYMLSKGKLPSGNMSGEDCIGFNPDSASVANANGSWKVVDGSHWMFDFGSKEEEARQALAIIKKYRVSYSCFVGRPDPSFSYLRR